MSMHELNDPKNEHIKAQEQRINELAAAPLSEKPTEQGRSVCWRGLLIFVAALLYIQSLA